MSEPTPDEVAVTLIALNSGRGAKALASHLNELGLTHKGEPWTVLDVQDIRRRLTGGRGPSKRFGADVVPRQKKRKGKGAKRLKMR